MAKVSVWTVCQLESSYCICNNAIGPIVEGSSPVHLHNVQVDVGVVRAFKVGLSLGHMSA